jgi:CCR4-NOT transcription complex subunit 6
MAFATWCVRPFFSAAAAMPSRAARKARRRRAAVAISPAPAPAQTPRPSEPVAPPTVAHVPRAWQSAPLLPHGRRLAELAPHAPVVTFMTYNVLAQCYVSRRLFPSTDPRLLRKPRRRELLASDISRLVDAHDVSVLCLQELMVDEVPTILSALPPSFRAPAGASPAHTYKQRTSEGRTSCKHDGSGIFWCGRRFARVDHADHHVELNSVAADAELAELTNGDAAVRNCVCAFVCLRERATGCVFVVSSAHIFWDPQYPMIKLAQAAAVREAGFRLAARFGTRNLVLAGDWNSLPDSAVVDYLVRGAVDACHEECGGVGPAVLATVNERADGHGGMVCVPSVSGAEDAQTGQLTTLTHTFRGALDYVFASRGDGPGIRVVGWLSCPTARDFETAGIAALPCEGHPSDHLPVVARLEFGLREEDGGEFVDSAEVVDSGPEEVVDGEGDAVTPPWTRGCIVS